MTLPVGTFLAISAPSFFAKDSSFFRSFSIEAVDFLLFGLGFGDFVCVPQLQITEDLP
jgi:hypothetical protein